MLAPVDPASLYGKPSYSAFAVTHENRNLKNMLKTLLFTHCEKKGIKEPSAKGTKAQGGTHG